MFNIIKLIKKEKMSTKLKDLAAANLSKTADQKALDALTDQVERNEMQFKNDEFAAKGRVKTATKALDALSSNPTVTARQIIDAQDEVTVATAELQQITDIIAARF